MTTTPNKPTSIYLENVKAKRAERDRVTREFEVDVRRALDKGHSLREVARAAGYTDTRPVRHIRDKA